MMTFKKHLVLRPSMHLPTLLLLAAFMLCSQPAKALENIAAIVNNDVILVSELRAEAQKIASSQKINTTQKQLFKDVLEKLILDKIQVQKAKSIGIKIPDTELDRAMLRIAKQNKLNLQQLRTAMIKQGLDYKAFREDLRNKLYSDNLRKRQQSTFTISDDQIDELIQAESFNLSKGVQFELVDIFIPTKKSTVQSFNASYRNAQLLRKKLLTTKSLDQALITKYGARKMNLGWKNSQSLSPIYSRTISLMGKGEISDVIRDARGFHVLQLVNRRGGTNQNIIEARARHILIGNATKNAQLLATKLRNKILAGEKFSDLAIKYSADKGSAVNGGELPLSNTANYVPPFAKVVNTIALNSISTPIKTKFGWHIIEVLERKQSDKTRENLKNKAKQLVTAKGQEENLKHWLKSLRDEAFVEYRIKL